MKLTGEIPSEIFSTHSNIMELVLHRRHWVTLYRVILNLLDGANDGMYSSMCFFDIVKWL